MRQKLSRALSHDIDSSLQQTYLYQVINNALKRTFTRRFLHAEIKSWRWYYKGQDVGQTKCATPRKRRQQRARNRQITLHKIFLV